jgi:hypothetical protein
MIRLATLEDVPRLVEMGLNFRGTTSYEKLLRENPSKMKELAEKLIQCQALLVSERDGSLVGMLGFFIYDHFISGEKVAGEVFWWQEPGKRGDGLKLMKEFERIAKEAGAKQIQMVAPTDQVARVYKHMKYEFVEASYSRTL